MHMSLPFSQSFLTKALESERHVEGMYLKHQQIGELLLPSSELVACDPFVSPEREAFSLLMPKGKFHVPLSISEFETDQRVAFGIVRFNESAPVAWDMLSSRRRGHTDPGAGTLFWLSGRFRNRLLHGPWCRSRS
jgi:hypothetical protein